MQPLRKILEQSDAVRSFFTSRSRISIFRGRSHAVEREINQLKQVHGEKIAIFNCNGWPKKPDEEIETVLFAGKIAFIIHQQISRHNVTFTIGYSRYLPSALNVEPALEGPINL